MSQQEDLDLLTRAFDSQVHQIRAHVEAFARIYWKSMPDYRQDNINRMIDAIVPRVAAGQLQIARLTNAYLLQCLTLLDLPPQTVPVDPDEITHARGMEPREVYHRPASTVYAKLAAGKSLDEAVRAGGLRLHQLIGGDMQLAHRNQAHKTLSRGRSDGIRAYRRVLTGRENCALCVVASTQRYWVEDLLPIHPGCDCNVQPLPPGMEGSQVIDQDLLDRAHAAVEARYGSYAPDAREIDYKKMILVTEHGEYGPVMGWKETITQRRKRLLNKSSWVARHPEGKEIPAHEARPTYFTEEFIHKVCYGIDGKGGHLYGHSLRGEFKKKENTEFPKTWTPQKVRHALLLTLHEPDIQFAYNNQWRFYRKKVDGVICEIKYSYSRKRNAAKLNYFVPLSGTVQTDGIEYYVKVLTEAGYFDVPLDLSNLDTSDIMGV